MTSEFPASPLYALLDAESCERRGFGLLAVAEAWRDAGIRLLQYRDKLGSDAAVLNNALAIGNLFAATGACLILNDRVHLVRETGWHGVHVGQGDMPLDEARRIAGRQAILGMSTHTASQVEAAHDEDCDYIAVGPVFATSTKLDAEPKVGLAGVRQARALTTKPLVAIGGIKVAHAPDVLAAGADCIATIGALLVGDPGKCASQFLQSLRR